MLVAMVLMIVLLRNQWSILKEQSWELNWGWLVLSLFFLLTSWAIEIGIWLKILRLLNARLPYWSGVRIWFLSAVVRYIPGNIWQPLSMTWRCQQRGIRPEATITSILIFQIVILIAAGPIAALYFGLYGNYGLLTSMLSKLTEALLFVILVPVIIFLARPDWLLNAANWGLNVLGRTPLLVTLSTLDLSKLLGIAIVHWLLWGLSFAALVFGMSPYSLNEVARLLPHLVSSFAIAYTIGFISFITPSGFGVREGVFIILLAPLLGNGPATVAALAMRLWSTAGELAVASICGTASSAS